jgi:hypothetical protein
MDSFLLDDRVLLRAVLIGLDRAKPRRGVSSKAGDAGELLRTRAS